MTAYYRKDFESRSVGRQGVCGNEAWHHRLMEKRSRAINGSSNGIMSKVSQLAVGHVLQISGRSLRHKRCQKNSAKIPRALRGVEKKFR